MMNNSGPAVAVSGLQVVRGKRRVVPGLDLEIPAGQVIGLLGPSGSGKSTLMRCFVGVQIIESGTVTVLGHPAGSPVLRPEVGYVTQSPSVYADLSVRDNVRAAQSYGVSAIVLPAGADGAVLLPAEPQAAANAATAKRVVNRMVFLIDVVSLFKCGLRLRIYARDNTLK